MRFTFLLFTFLLGIGMTESFAQIDTTGLPPSVQQKIMEYEASIGRLTVENQRLEGELEAVKGAAVAQNDKCQSTADDLNKRITSLEQTVETYQETERRLKEEKGARGDRVGELEKENRGLRSELENVRKSRTKLEGELAGLQDEAKELKTLRGQVAELAQLQSGKLKLEKDFSDVRIEASDLKKERDRLERQLKKANDENASLNRSLAVTESELNSLKKECAKYAADIKLRLTKLGEDVNAAFGAQSMSALPLAKRQRLLQEASALKDNVAAEDQREMSELHARVLQLENFGIVMETAKTRLSEDFASAKVRAAADNLRNADSSGMNNSLIGERVNLLRLLQKYEAEYCRARRVFNRLNDAGDADLTKDLTALLLATGGDLAIDPGFVFLRKEIEQRQANPSASHQPFAASTNCSN